MSIFFMIVIVLAAQTSSLSQAYFQDSSPIRIFKSKDPVRDCPDTFYVRVDLSILSLESFEKSNVLSFSPEDVKTRLGSKFDWLPDTYRKFDLAARDDYRKACIYNSIRGGNRLSRTVLRIVFGNNKDKFHSRLSIETTQNGHEEGIRLSRFFQNNAELEKIIASPQTITILDLYDYRSAETFASGLLGRVGVEISIRDPADK